VSWRFFCAVTELIESGPDRGYKAMKPIVVWLVFAVAACGIHVRPHDPNASGLPPSRGVGPGGPEPTSSDPRTSDGGPQNTCRASRLPSDWVIVDYVESSECPSLGGERYNGARIIRHATFPRGVEIVVCADQRVPRGWRRQGRVEDADLESLCRSSLRTRPLSERVMRIHREYKAGTP
jgi:hypothetical protein